MKDLGTHLKESILDTTDSDFDVITAILGGKEDISAYDLKDIPNIKYLKELVLPEGIKSIVRVGSYSISEICSSLERIVFPSTLQEIGWDTFAHMKNLEEVVFNPKCKDVYILGGAFNGCAKLRSVNIPRGAVLGVRSFIRCTDLTDISFDKIVDLQGDSIFRDCTSLRKVDMSKVVISKSTLPSRIFFGCTRLEEVSLHGGTKTIDMLAFYKCKNLAKVKAPGVDTVNPGAFDECTKLKTRP